MQVQQELKFIYRLVEQKERGMATVILVLQHLDVYTEWKSIYVDFSGKLQRAQIDN